MKSVFIGNVISSERFLSTLISIGVNISGVVTAENTGSNADYFDLRPLCSKSSIDYITCLDVNDEETIKWIEEKQPDIIFCFGWSQIIRSKLLGVPRIGVIGFHPAYLPRNRGRHPIIWALALGLHETASSFFFMDTGADSGDIISQVPIEIDEHDDANSLYDKITKVASSQLKEFVPRLMNGEAIGTKQNHALANYWRRRGHADGVIDWRMSAKSIYNLVRALTRPYIGAEFVHKGIIYKVWQCSVIPKEGLDNIEPGKVIDIDNGLLIIKCADHCIKLDRVEPALKLNLDAYL